MDLKIKTRTIATPLAAFKRGQFICFHCGGLLSMEGLEPLASVLCTYCQQELPVPQRIAGFWLFHRLGGGGMGVVYRACHEEYPEKFYAVKILPRGRKKRNPRLVRNLENEASIAQRLGEHPCLVRLLAWGFADDEHYMAMDYISGDRLDQKIKKLGTLPEGEVLLIALRVVSGLSHIYNRGYLYRDLKPGNIIIDEKDGAYLYDFGICMSVEEAMEEPEEDIVAGTPLYFAPERLTGAGETPASEIYSLGMVMYHALRGETYFSARELETSLAKEDRPTTLLLRRNKMEGISPDLAKILEKMIQREVGKRYQCFHEVERDLLRLVWLRVRRGDPCTFLTENLGAVAP